MTYKTRVKEPDPPKAVRREPLPYWHKAPGPTVSSSKAMIEIRKTLAGAKGGFVVAKWRHISGNSGIDPKDWARVLKVRHEAGEILSLIQVEAYESALDEREGT